MSKFIPPKKQTGPDYSNQAKPKLSIKVDANGEPVTLTEYDLMAIVSDLVARQGRHDRDIQAIKDAMGTAVKKPEQPVLKLPKLNQVAADVNPVKLQ